MGGHPLGQLPHEIVEQIDKMNGISEGHTGVVPGSFEPAEIPA